MSDRQKYQLILTVTISENSKIHLGQISQVETISKLKKKLLHFENSSDVFRISGCGYSYCDYSVIGGFGWMDWVWLAASAVGLQVSDYSQLSDYIVRLQLHRMIFEK